MPSFKTTFLARCFGTLALSALGVASDLQVAHAHPCERPHDHIKKMVIVVTGGGGEDPEPEEEDECPEVAERREEYEARKSQRRKWRAAIEKERMPTIAREAPLKILSLIMKREELEKKWGIQRELPKVGDPAPPRKMCRSAARRASTSSVGANEAIARENLAKLSVSPGCEKVDVTCGPVGHTIVNIQNGRVVRRPDGRPDAVRQPTFSCTQHVQCPVQEYPCYGGATKQ